MSVKHEPAGELLSGEGFATLSHMPVDALSKLTAIVPAAHEGGCVTWHVPQLQAPGALGPSTTSWLGDVAKPDGHAEVCAGAKATSVHPLGTVTHDPGELAQGSCGGGPASGRLAIDASGTC
jgi:hypothetical protein